MLGKIVFRPIFYLRLFFVKLYGLKDCHFGQFWTINARFISRYQRVSVDLFRLCCELYYLNRIL